MSTSTLTSPLRGVVSPLITPLEDIDILDRSGLERLIEHVIRGGVSGIFLLGTSGEGPALSYRLRSELIQSSCKQVHGRVPLLVGITDTAYVESRRLAEVAAEAGADAVVVAPPYYSRYSQSDLLKYIERLSQALPLPLFLYNFPGLTKIPYDPETVKRASEIPQVIGLKDSSGDLSYLAAVIGLVRNRTDFTVLMGPEEKLLEALRQGAHGGVCGGTNVYPDDLVALQEAAWHGQWQYAEALQHKVNEMAKLLYSVGDPESSYLRGVKCAAALLGLCRGALAPPLQPFSEPERLQIERALRTLGFTA